MSEKKMTLFSIGIHGISEILLESISRQQQQQQQEEQKKSPNFNWCHLLVQGF
jgi:hypothetical protein